MNYNADNKRILKNTIMLYLRSILMILIGLYTSRITLSALGVDDFGIYNLVGGVITLFIIISSTMTSATQRFITFSLGKKDNEELRNVFETSISLHLIIAIIIFLLLESIGLWLLYNKLNIPRDRLFSANVVLQFSIITTCIDIICVPYDAIIIAYEKMNAFAYMGIYDALMKLLVSTILLFANVDKLILFSFLLFVIALSKRVIYSIYTNKNFAVARNIRYHIHKPIFKEMFSFASWNLLGNASLILRNHGIEILMNLFFGVAINAAKGVCNVVQGNIGSFVSNFQTAVNPQLTKSVADNKLARTRFLICQGGRFSFFLLTIFCIPLMLCLNDVLSLWLINIPPYTNSLIYVTLIYMLWDSLSRFLINSILATGNIRNYQLLAGGTKLLAFPLAYVAFKLGGNPLWGIYINIILELLCLFIRLIFTRQRINLSIKKYVISVVFRCWGIFVFCYLICDQFVRRISNNIFFLLPASFICVLLFIYIFGINANERIFVKKKCTSFISTFKMHKR